MCFHTYIMLHQTIEWFIIIIVLGKKKFEQKKLCMVEIDSLKKLDFNKKKCTKSFFFCMFKFKRKRF